MNPARTVPVRGVSRTLICVLLLGGALVSAATISSRRAFATGATPESIGQHFVPSVLGALSGLSPSADALVVAKNGAPNPTECKHIEGLARANAPDGTPYIFMTKSGLVPGFPAPCFGDNEPGYLFVARMGSRPKTPERLGTNYLPYDSPLADLPALAGDKIVTVIPFDGSNGIPAYYHPGGMQILGDVLAIGVENPFGAEDPAHRAAVLFFNIHDPEHPQYFARFDAPDEAGDANQEFGADPVGLTAIRAADGTCCRFLMIVAGGPANKEVRFFESLPDPNSSSTDLTSPSLAWFEVRRFSEDALDACGMDWPTGGTGQHQMLNFVREGNLDGPLYLIGGRRTGAIVDPFSDEELDLYRVNLDDSGLPQTHCPLTHVKSKEMGTGSWGGDTYTGSFAAGSSVYVTPSGELIVYVSNHEGSPGDTIFFGEYRIGSVVRADGA